MEIGLRVEWQGSLRGSQLNAKLFLLKFICRMSGPKAAVLHIRYLQIYNWSKQGIRSLNQSHEKTFLTCFAVALSRRGSLDIYCPFDPAAGRAIGAERPYTHKFSIGPGDDGQLRHPKGVAIMPGTGEIVVTDTGHHSVHVFGSDGTFLRRFGSRGSGDGQLNAPVGVAVDKAGQIIVADQGNHRIQVFDSEGAFARKFEFGDTLWNFVNCVAVNAAGDIIVTRNVSQAIEVFGKDGSLLRQVALTSDGKSRFLPRTAGVTADAAGQIIVTTSNDEIQIFDADGNFTQKFGRPGSGLGEFDRPAGVAVGGSGEIIIVDTRNHRIQVWTQAAPNTD